MRYVDGFRDHDAARFLRDRVHEVATRLADRGVSVRLMEVCGSHSVAVARYGIRSLLPDNVELVSGPGCPVCVTAPGFIDAAVELARRGYLLATFGDMVQVPGSHTSLAKVRSEGAGIHIVYAPDEAVDLAQAHPDREIIFIAVGFETTAPAVVSIVRKALELRLENLSLLCAFKLVPPALEALIADPEVAINGLLCPPHVSTIIGSDAYRSFVEEDGLPCVIAGFEPLDILYGILSLLVQLREERPRLENHYSRVVRREGNRIAQREIEKYLEKEDAEWRGMGLIPRSGLQLRPEYATFDAARRFSLPIKKGKTNRACRCGDVLRGKIHPPECPLFGRVCSPDVPFGPCMVSSEGSCAAWHNYSGAC